MAYDKMSFEDVDNVFHSLFNAFHPDGVEGENDVVDERFEALFTIFLEFAHWSRDEYWDAVDAQDCKCSECVANEKEQAEKEKLSKN